MRILKTLSERRPRTAIALFAALLLLLLLAVNAPMFSNPSEFTSDDNYYIVFNQRIQSGLLTSLGRIWLSPMQFDYFPVTLTSFAVDYRLWGPNAGMFKATNLFLFFCISLLAALLARRFSADPDSPALPLSVMLATLVLALHPKNVESIGLASDRKELLWVLFGLGALAWHATKGTKGKSGIVTICLVALAQLSKGTAVVVPLLLMLHDLIRGEKPLFRKKQVLFYAILAALSGAIFSFQYAIAPRPGVVDILSPLVPEARIGGVIVTVNQAILHILIPAHLSYEYDLSWPTGIAAGWQWLLPAALALLLAALLYFRKRMLLMFVLFLIIPFLPSANIIPLKHVLKGHLVFYDHYLLFSCMAAVPLAAQAINAGLQSRWRPLAIAVPIALAVVFAVYDHHLSGFWQTKERFYQRNIEMAPGLSRSYHMLGEVYYSEGRYVEARDLAERALAKNREGRQGYKEADVIELIGDASYRAGMFERAEAAYREYLTLKSDPEVMQKFYFTLREEGKGREADDVKRRISGGEGTSGRAKRSSADEGR